MEKYLKIGDYFGGCLSVSSGTRERIVSAKGEVIATTPSPQVAKVAVHAINSHDELVEMNKELLAALELMLLIHDEPSGFCGKFGKELDMAIEDQKEKIDTRIAIARNAIAKAKATS